VDVGVDECGCVCVCVLLGVRVCLCGVVACACLCERYVGEIEGVCEIACVC